MGGYKDFVTGQVLTAADVQDYLMDQSVMVFAGTASRGSAITSPSEGMVVYLSDTDEVQVYNGTSWSAVGGGAAVLSNTPTGTYTSGGTAYAYYEFTASGTATVTRAGYADVLIVGGGGSGHHHQHAFPGSEHCYGAGGAGGYIEATVFLNAGGNAVTIGAGGSANGGDSSFAGLTANGGGAGGSGTGSSGASGGGGGGYGGAASGGASNVSATVVSPLQGYSGGNAATGGGAHGGGGGGAGGPGANNVSGLGFNSSITGSSVTYCSGGIPGNNTAGSANTGNGGGSSTAGGPIRNGGSGIVIIRVRT